MKKKAITEIYRCFLSGSYVVSQDHAFSSFQDSIMCENEHRSIIFALIAITSGAPNFYLISRYFASKIGM